MTIHRFSLLSAIGATFAMALVVILFYFLQHEYGIQGVQFYVLLVLGSLIIASLNYLIFVNRQQKVD